MAQQRYYVGIDLGTTFSSLAYVDEAGRVEALRLPDGTFQVASVVYCKSPTEVVVGAEALNYALLDLARAARKFKRYMGDTSFQFAADGKAYRPEELSALVLRKLLEAAAEQLGPIEHAVISVPYVFDELRRRATQVAGDIAGLKSVDMIEEPVAAALAYGHMLMQSGGFSNYEDVYIDQTVLVYDLGGGTFDATVMELSRVGGFKVVATGGDERLGGEEWDNALLEILCERFEQRNWQNPREDKEVMQELWQKAGQAKHTLSERPNAEVEIAYRGQKDKFIVTRGEFETKTEPFLTRTEHTLADMLESRNLSWGHIDRVLMVGGSSRMKMVGKMLERVAKRPLDTSLPPDIAIAKGAALFAAHRSGQNKVVKQIQTVNSHPLGLMVRDSKTRQFVNQVLLPANAPALTRVCQVYRMPDRNKPLELRILLGDAPSPDACVLLGRTRFKGLADDLTPQDRIEVVFCFQENGLLQVEGTVRRADGRVEKSVQFDVVVEGKMDQQDVDAAKAILRGISIE